MTEISNPAGTVLGAWLRENGKRQVLLAKTLGVTPALVSFWIAGERVPSAILRAAIERWTAGAVTSASWLSAAGAARERQLARLRAAVPT